VLLALKHQWQLTCLAVGWKSIEYDPIDPANQFDSGTEFAHSEVEVVLLALKHQRLLTYLAEG
jgi:hypothetical protein